MSSRSSGDRVQARQYVPPDDLADVVECYWVGAWDLRGQAPHTTELLGDPCVHLVVEHGDTLTESRIVGVWTRLWRRTLAERGRVLGVKLRPGAGRAFLPEATNRFSNRITPLAEHFVESESLAHRLCALDDEIRCFDAMSDWLRAQRRPDHSGDISLAMALMARVMSDPSITSVERFAAVAGLHPRVLERLFVEHVGAAPKGVIRRRRLQDVAQRVEAGEAVSLAGLAAELGYTDQAHLTRDFKTATGQTPRSFGIAVHR